MVKYFLIFFPLLFACNKRNLKNVAKEIKNNASNSVNELEARFFDIPFPFAIQSLCQVTETHLLYTVNTDSASLITYFKENFELLGWDQTGFFTTDQKTILFFKKPQKKLCLLISIDSDKVLQVEILIS